MYHRHINEAADIEKSYQWLHRAGLKDSTEAVIMAAQEQFNIVISLSISYSLLFSLELLYS